MKKKLEIDRCAMASARRSACPLPGHRQRQNVVTCANFESREPRDRSFAKARAFFLGLLPLRNSTRTILFFFPFSGTARSLQNRFVSVAVSPRGRDQWERSVRVSGSGETLGKRGPVEDEAKGRPGLGPFLHPPSRKTPTPFFVKMFAVAAQTTVRATAQVKATKVAAKEQKSAYVPSRFPASSISRRFFHPRRSASARATARRRRRRIARGVRARTRRASTRIDTARIARRDGRARLRASSPSSSASREQRNRGNKSRGRDTHRKKTVSVPLRTSAVPSPPRLPAPPPRCSCSRPPPRSRTASRCRTAPTPRPASTSSPSTIPAPWWRLRRIPPRTSPPKPRASLPTSRRA